MNKILFDQASANLDSPTFEANGQVTIIGLGLQPDDFITFEVVKVRAGAAVACGCRLIGPVLSAIEGTLELLCPSCESEASRPVRLTERNPVVIIDMPQDTLLRAIYHGTGVDLRTVNVWAETTNTPDLTDAMRGCPPVCCEDEPQTWDVTGIHRCTDTDVEVQEISNCGNKRWVICGDVVWTDTGQIRCLAGGAATEIEQTNQCGHRRWTAGPAQVWVETGVTRCVESLLRVQETNQCGGLRWIDTAEVCGAEGATFVDCEGAPIPSGTALATCADLDNAAIGAIEILDTVTVNLSGDGTPATPLNADVNLSTSSGNLLEVRGDGLYYGLEAPPAIAFLYVSTTLGNDANPGTLASPLATLDRAFELQVNAPVNYQIRLRAGETFTQTVRWNRNLAKYIIGYYDDPTYPDGPASACTGYLPMYADDLARPTWIVDAYLSAGQPVNTGVVADALELRGIRVLGRWELPDTTQPTVALAGLTAAGGVTLHGCVLNSTLQPRSRWLFVTSSVDLATTVVDFSTDGLTYLVNTSGPVNARIGALANPGGCGVDTPPITALVASQTAARAMVTVNNLAAGGSYHAATKSAWGVTPAWDLFAGVPACCDETPVPGNTPPTASFTTAGTALALDFTDTSVDGDGTITSWLWNFGDGATSTTQSPSHAYGAGGSYFVQLTVTDDDGATNMITRSIAISAGDSGGGNDPPSGPNYPPTSPV